MSFVPIVAAAAIGALGAHQFHLDCDFDRLKRDLLVRCGVKKAPESLVSNVVKGCVVGLRTGGTLVGGALAIWGAVAAARHYRRRKARTTILSDTQVVSLVTDAAHYDPAFRDCQPGESHDILVYEDEEENEAVVGAEEGTDSDAPPGLRRRKPVTRRVQKRKKYVHEPDERGAARESYLSFVVIEARNVYGARAATEHNMSLARGYMVRLMKEHGVRPSHIDGNIDRMVNAVFLLTDTQLQARRDFERLHDAGRIRMFGTN